VKTYVVRDVNTSGTPEEGAHSPSWPNGLIIIIIIIISSALSTFVSQAYYYHHLIGCWSVAISCYGQYSHHMLVSSHHLLVNSHDLL
jgi:hypothetical protein